MPRRSLSRDSFFDPKFVMPGCLQEGTVPWVLGRYRSTLFPAWLFQGWRGEKQRGRAAWPAEVLMTLVVLRWSEEGMSRRCAAKRAQNDITWRAAMGLELGTKGPDEKTLRDFEAFVARRHPSSDTPRYLLVHEHLVRQCQRAAVVGASPLWSMDSTPMWCYGAVKDTVRLLGDGVASLARQWADATGDLLKDLGVRWGLPHLEAKSTKGAFRIDWRSADARAQVIDTLAQGVTRAVDEIRQKIERVASSKRKRLLRQCRQLVRVIQCDLDSDDKGRLVVARRVVKDRLISLSDPQARHGHKSQKQTFQGFKVHLLGDALSGLITALTVTPGNAHDGSVAHRLIGRAKRLDRELGQLLGDTAYGSAQLRHQAKHQLGVTIVAPPPPVTAKPSSLGRASISFDFEAEQATCAAGITVDAPLRVFTAQHQRTTLLYRWPASACQSCALRQPCNGNQAYGHRVLMHPYEPELRQARTDWQTPHIRELYRSRSQTERLIAYYAHRDHLLHAS